jgi:hypothetical protein
MTELDLRILVARIIVAADCVILRLGRHHRCLPYRDECLPVRELVAAPQTTDGSSRYLVFGKPRFEIERATMLGMPAMLAAPFGRAILSTAFLLMIPATAITQDRSVEESRKRIVALERRFKETSDTTALNAIAADIHREVDARIRRDFASTSRARLDAAVVANRLQQILADATENAPVVFAGGPADHRHMIVAYCLCNGRLMGANATSVTVRAYNQTARGLAFADSTGENMNGFADLIIKEVRAPAPDPGAPPPRATFVLLSGYMTGANGPANRMRIYAFDGQRFRPVWMPEDMWGRFDVQVSADRFTVDGDYYRQDRKRHDTYAVSEDGVRLIPPVVR